MTLIYHQGMFDIGRLKDGDVVCISGAAGSVGLVSPSVTIAKYSS